MSCLLNKVTPDNAWAWLPLLAVLSLPFGRSIELFVLIMAIVGIYDLIKNYNDIKQTIGFKLFSVFFLCFWIPALLSLVDAVNLAHSSENVFGMIRFYFAGLFIINRIKTYKSHLWLGIGISFVMLFWSFDGWLQLISGTDIFGQPPYSANRISGIFGDDARLGLMIIPFFGIVIATIKEKLNFRIALIATLIISSAILISGDRASWVSLFTLTVIFFTLFPLKNFSYKEIRFIILGAVILLSIVISTPTFQSRFNNTVHKLSFDYDTLNRATSYRLPIWGTAIRMFADNPINGVGVRGFRYAYPDYALPNDRFVHSASHEIKKTGAFQPHQIVLEFMSVTGIIGVTGYIIALWLLFGKWRKLSVGQDSILANGYLISLMTILFPINTHLSFFSSSNGQVIWFLTALCVSALILERN